MSAWLDPVFQDEDEERGLQDWLIWDLPGQRPRRRARRQRRKLPRR
ncbi:MAG TPA: hypothetical protein VFA33_07475 [Bryobacteraceae bacterium]|nr:hypothetical protein [Bryobacteraceae bacterium]